MDDIQKYLFDLQGYLVLEDVLSPDGVNVLLRLIDVQSLPEPSLESHQGRFGRFLAWGQPFCDLLDHPVIMPVLKFLLGDGALALQEAEELRALPGVGLDEDRFHVCGQSHRG